ncbi:MAG TPA: hypothetical protein VK956_02865 [Verrucomicrobium sp.]|nr:hypothetical protein [Verrucomicrobium sp.]
MELEFNRADLDPLARLLAGLEAADLVDPFLAERASEAWQEHARVLDGLFARFASGYARPFAVWSQTHLQDFRKLDTVFYPFSGPDFMYAHLLHPAASTILLGGLEACEAPHANSMTNLWPPRLEFLSDLSSGIRHFLEHSFFITAEMRETFGSSRWNGILVPLLVFLSRTDHCITGIESTDLPGSSVTSGGPPARIIRIRALFQGKVRQICYIQKHLRDDHCPPSDAFFQFAGSFGPLGVFLKSASYLLHEPDFSHLRDFIFDRGACLVQDPSSIPYEGLLDRGWRVKVHGQYQRSPRVFPQYEQPRLIEVCQTNGAPTPALPFGFGYHHQPCLASLMIASPRPKPALNLTRNKTAATAAVTLSPCWEAADPS